MKSEVKHIGDICSDQDPCGPRGSVVAASLVCHDGVCRRSTGSTCLSDEDCAGGCAAGSNTCICTDSGGSSEASVCARSSCPEALWGTFAEWVCSYNAWHKDYWNNPFTDKSLYGLLQTQEAELRDRTNRAILELFLKERKYANQFTVDQLQDISRRAVSLYLGSSAQIIGRATLTDSLPASYGLYQGARLLVATGQLASMDTFGKRMKQTQDSIMAIMSGMAQPDGIGLWSAYLLGKRHANLDRLAGKGLYGAQFNETKDPVISMEGMLWTELTFSVVMLRATQEQAKWSQDDRNALTILWSLLGNALGVPYEFSTFEAAEEIFRRLKAGPDHYLQLPPENAERKAVEKLFGTFNPFKSAIDALTAKDSV